MSARELFRSLGFLHRKTMHNTQIHISVVTMTAAIMTKISQMRVNFIGPMLMMNEAFLVGAATDVGDGDIVVDVDAAVVIVDGVVIVVSRRKLTTTILETSLL